MIAFLAKIWKLYFYFYSRSFGMNFELYATLMRTNKFETGLWLRICLKVILINKVGIICESLHKSFLFLIL